MDPETSPRPSQRHWLYATLILCSYGFFKEFKPSEPFLTPYLVEVKNFTKNELNSEVWSYSTYSYLVAAFFTFLLTDLVRYKPVIILESACYLTTRILLIWGTTIIAMQWMQVAYGVAEATEIAYYSYIYAAVSVRYFKRVTSYVRAIRLFGQSMAGLLAQVLVTTKAMNYLQLNYISLASVTVACVISLFLPNVFNCTTSCNRKPCPEDQISLIEKQSGQAKSCIQLTKEGFMNKLRDFAKFYCVPSLLKWSIWWALATCGVLQIGNFVQSLWKEVADGSRQSHEWNGLVEALATLCSACAAFALSFIRVRWSEWGEVTIGLLSLVDSALLLLASWTEQLWVVYLCHIVYHTTYSFLITIASTQVALSVDHESYALIFGFNYFIALVLQTILTFVVADEHGLNLDIRTQFQVYSGYYYILTMIFIGVGIYKLTSAGWLRSCRQCWVPSEQDSVPEPKDDSEDEERVVITPAKASIQADCEGVDRPV